MLTTLLLILIVATHSNCQSIAEIVKSNPLLSNMVMFQDPRMKLALKRSSEPERVSDNFDDRYKQLNASLFEDVELTEYQDLEYREMDVDRMPTGRALFDEDEDVPETTTKKEDETPFEASEDIFDVNEIAEQSTIAIGTTSDDDPAEQFFNTNDDDDDNPANNLIDITSPTAYPFLSTSQFTGSTYMQVETTPIPLESPRSMQLSKSDEYRVVPQFNGKYRVSATKYYTDNRIDSDSYADRFAVENELRRMHAVATAHRRSPISLDEVRAGENDEVKMMSIDGKLVEQRVMTDEKKTIRLWNRMLHGHDYLRAPGAIFDITKRQRARVAGVKNEIAKKSKNDESELSSNCYKTFYHRVGANESEPRKVQQNISRKRCLIECAASSQCETIIFKMKKSTNTTSCLMYSSKIPVKPQRDNPNEIISIHRRIDSTQECVKMIIEPAVFKKFDDLNKVDWLRRVEKNRRNSQRLSNDKRCGNDMDRIFVRSDLINRPRLLGNSSARILKTTEDDCVFACLTNTAPNGDIVDCSSVEYDPETSVCRFIGDDDVEESIEQHGRHAIAAVNLYEKICVTKSISLRCSGGQPVRLTPASINWTHLQPITSLVVRNPIECISECIRRIDINNCTIIATNLIKRNSQPMQVGCHLYSPAIDSSPQTSHVADDADYFRVDDCSGIREIPRNYLL